MKCLKVRLYPTKPQQSRLEETLETCRRVYNRMLVWCKDACEQTGKAPSKTEQQKALPGWKRGNEYLGRVHSQVLQHVARRLELAFDAFFERLKNGENPGYPRFKGRVTTSRSPTRRAVLNFSTVKCAFPKLELSKQWFIGTWKARSRLVR